MNRFINEANKPSAFLVKSTLAFTALVAAILIPTSLISFIQGRTLLGTGSLVFGILCVATAWNCAHDRYQPLRILFGFTPFIIIFVIFAFRDLGHTGAFWCYPAVIGLYFILPEKYAWAANTVLFFAILPDSLDVMGPSGTARFSATLLVTSFFAGSFLRVITQQQMKLEVMAVTDSLTGLFNRTLLQSYLEKALQQNRRMDTPMTIIMIDIDHFKTINDTCGHSVGDNVLIGIGAYFQQRIRSADTIFRIGGEEFLALLHDTNISNACVVANEICNEVEQLPLLPDKTITVSIGVSELQSEDKLSDWMKRSDKNLYTAKSKGRNQVAS